MEVRCEWVCEWRRCGSGGGVGGCVSEGGVSGGVCGCVSGGV